jgi:hypothetical protein
MELLRSHDFYSSSWSILGYSIVGFQFVLIFMF